MLGNWEASEPWEGKAGLRHTVGCDEPQETNLTDRGEGSGWASLDFL